MRNGLALKRKKPAETCVSAGFICDLLGYRLQDGDLHEEFLVPTARLELAQLSPLPPQDSVSTNFTTSANLTRKDVLSWKVEHSNTQIGNLGNRA